jgi:hypothetical protein
MDSKAQKAKYAKQSKIFLLISPLIAILGLFDYSKLKGTDSEVHLDSLTFSAKFLYHYGGENSVLLVPLIFALLFLFTGLFYLYKSKR